MTATERLAIIRAKCRQSNGDTARPAGLHVAATGGRPVTRKTYVHKALPGEVTGTLSGHAEQLRHFRKKWVTKADVKEAVTFKEGNAHGPHHLNIIAERWASASWRSETKRLDLRHA